MNDLLITAAYCAVVVMPVTLLPATRASAKVAHVADAFVTTWRFDGPP